MITKMIVSKMIKSSINNKSKNKNKNLRLRINVNSPLTTLTNKRVMRKEKKNSKLLKTT